VTKSDDRLIEAVYQTAIDPLHFEALNEHWVARIAAAVNSDDDAGPDLERHLQAAFEISGRTDTGDVSAAQPTLHFSAAGTATDLNTAAAASYEIGRGDHFGQLPFDKASLKTIGGLLAGAVEGHTSDSLFTGYRTDIERRVVIQTQTSDLQVRLRTNDFVWPDRLSPVLKKVFELTDAEVDVARLAVQGASNAEIADSRNTSKETVRAQIRAIYGKTEAHSTADLTRLVMGLTQFTQAQTQTNDADAYPRPVDRHLLKLPDGRILDFAVFGASNGLPVLFFHDENVGDGWTRAAVHQARRMGLRIIAPARPCYGRTDNTPNDVPERRMQVAHDMIHLMDHLECDAFAVIARGMGGGASACLSSLIPSRVLGIVSVAPALPAREEDLRKMHPFVRMMIWGVLNSPSLARFLIRSRVKYTRRAGVMSYLRGYYKDASVDLDLLDDPEIARALEKGSELCESQQFRGFLADVIDGKQPTPKQAASLLRTKHFLLIGEHDRNARMHRALHLAELTDLIEIVTVPGAGEQFFYTEHQRILSLAQSFFPAKP